MICGDLWSPVIVRELIHFVSREVIGLNRTFKLKKTWSAGNPDTSTELIPRTAAITRAISPLGYSESLPEMELPWRRRNGFVTLMINFDKSLPPGYYTKQLSQVPQLEDKIYWKWTRTYLVLGIIAVERWVRSHRFPKEKWSVTAQGPTNPVTASTCSVKGAYMLFDKVDSSRSNKRSFFIDPIIGLKVVSSYVTVSCSNKLESLLRHE